MEKNIGTVDRIIRIVIGIALLAWAFGAFGPSNFLWLGWLGVIPLATALVNWCPAYAIIGVKTCPAPTKSDD